MAANVTLSNQMPPRPPGNIIELQPNSVYGDVPFQLPLYTMPAVDRWVLRHEQVDYDRGGALEQDASFIGELEHQGGLLGLGQDVQISPASSTGAPPPYALPTQSPSGPGITTTVSALPPVKESPAVPPWGSEPFTGNFQTDHKRCTISCSRKVGRRQLPRCVQACDRAAAASRKQRRGAVPLGGLDEYPGPNTPRVYMTGLGEYPGPNTPRVYLDGLGATKKPAKAVAPPATVEVGIKKPVSSSTMYAVIGGAAVVVLGSIAFWAYNRAKGKK